MKVGIYDLRDLNGNDLPVQKAYEKILAHNGIESVRLSIEDDDFWEIAADLSLFIMRFQHYDNKVIQYFLMRAHGFPMTRSWIFYEKKKALDWARSASYPLVFKLRAGAGSMNVVLVQSPRQAENLIKRMFGKGLISQGFYAPGLLRFEHFHPFNEVRHLLGNLNRSLRGLDPHPFWTRHRDYILFQKYLAGNKFDTRITVIGERAFGFRRMTRPDDFRASGSGLLNYEMDQIDLRCVEIAHQVSREMGFQSMAYDFLFNEEGEPEFCEISYTYLSRAVQACPGYWDRDLNWHEGQYWPEYLHLVDALGMPELKMPYLDY